MDKKDKIIVSFTTWKKRDEDAVLMVEHLQKQTIHPDEIILWLSESEYNGVIPKHLQECLDNGWITDIRFVPGNTYAHKRYEVFKEHQEDFVILVDDDLYYPDDYIESLYIASKEKKCPCCYWGRTEMFIDTKRSFLEFKHSSFQNHIFSGLICFPPNTFPIESLEEQNIALRTAFCPRSDDAWMTAWFLKKNIITYSIHRWPINHLWNYVIGDSQDVGTVHLFNGKVIDGVKMEVRNIANSCAALDVVDKLKKVYPKFNIDKCANLKTYKDTQERLITNINNIEKLKIYTDVSEKQLSSVIYTCVTENEQLFELPKTDKCSFVCFTDQALSSDTWQIKPIPEELKTLQLKKQKEMIKICPHKYLSEYDLSIYVEPNKIGDLFDFELEDGKSVYMKGSNSGCVYKLANSLLNNKRDTMFNIRTHIFKYQQEGYPLNNGLADTDIIIRKHNDEYCIRLMEKWKSEVLRGSYVDRLSFNYCLWKIGDTGFKLLQDKIKSILR